ncbi:MAG: glycosyltransferase [Gammaproteobacteria bacterium]|nr:glycosyltransferase [Gammaproteobacteria bacterium]CAJ2377590.1 MAG: hypothetical protein IBGAMO2_860002 [Arenicellales bacterium IbO2]
MNSPQKPLVSIVMAAYNEEAHIADAIRSALAQTFGDFELIVVNDGSTDSTVEIIRSFRDARILCIDNRENKKLPAALNAGLGIARGKYIARADADDINVPRRLEMQVAFLEKHGEIGVLGGAYLLLPPHKKCARRFPKTHDECMRKLAHTPCVAHPTVMMRASALGNVRYNGDYILTEDFRLWVDLAKSGVRFANLPQVLVQYRESAPDPRKKPGEEKIQRDFCAHILGESGVMREFADVLAWLYEWSGAPRTLQVCRVSAFCDALGEKRFYFMKIIASVFRRRSRELEHRRGDRVRWNLLAHYWAGRARGN